MGTGMKRKNEAGRGHAEKYFSSSGRPDRALRGDCRRQANVTPGEALRAASPVLHGGEAGPDRRARGGLPRLPAQCRPLKENSQQLRASSTTLSQKASSAPLRYMAQYMDCGAAMLVRAITSLRLLSISVK